MRTIIDKEDLREHRHEVFGELQKRNGFVEAHDKGIVCPYCYRDFYSVIKRDVLEEILNAPRTKVGGRREWEY